MTISKVEATDISFDELKEGSELYIQRRNRRLLNNHRKELRVFTKAEAVAYLDIDARTLDKYCKALKINPRRHEESQWLLDIEEVYKVRDSLPDELKKQLPCFLSPSRSWRLRRGWLLV